MPLPAQSAMRVGWTFLVLLALLGCGTPQGLPPFTPLAPPRVRLTKLTEGFAFGVKMAFLDDGRLLITEKETGRVRLLTAAFALEPQPVLDVAVNYAGERGLLGIAAHPDFARNGYVYMAYVASTTSQDTTELKSVGGIHIARFRLAGTVAEGPQQTLITLPGLPGPYHNGGCLLLPCKWCPTTSMARPCVGMYS